MFVGFVGTFFPQFLLGNGGMPRRYYNYPAKFQTLHVMSTCFAFVLASGLVLTLTLLVHSLRRGKRAPSNPWGSASLEWRTNSPPPPHNFVGEPDFARGTYDYTEVFDE